ncbi:nucleotidyltransferase domain-containing protein [Dongia sedimenti]|uniref:Nucleotidyltransferase family protein n=1 Tax=Dongia sedimenti TaxID=3064282 RepID=A0ABU0YKB3_9PROT|nr:hypothetical protein [Rhodospirillaceae bacterium R-7]
MDGRTSNDREFLKRVFARLQHAGFAPLLFGGWAEELLGLAPARVHRDVDLLLPADSFAALDRFLGSAAAGDWREIAAKRFAHKRALLAEGVMVEFTLVEPGPVTRFWGDVEFRWLEPLAHDGPLAIDGVALPTVSAANLLRYRELHRTTEPWRWRAGVAEGGAEF